MSRKSFIQSYGATCKNWQWSWSFINTEKRYIIFGAWDTNIEYSRAFIFDEAWAKNYAGKKNKGYSESREHIRLIEEEGYSLFTFPIIFSGVLQDEKGYGPPKIKKFESFLSKKILIREGSCWYATDYVVSTFIPEEVNYPEIYFEGTTKLISVNAFERNRAAREACIKHFKAICFICKFDFEKTYGVIGKGFIHVHHIVPLHAISKEYEVNPTRDLIPVCPNCHAILHLKKETISVQEVKKYIAEAKNIQQN